MSKKRKSLQDFKEESDVYIQGKKKHEFTVIFYGFKEKKGYADYIINNQGSLEETKKQVTELWENLKKTQQEMIAARKK